jgi:hypothetical protein
LLDADSPVLHLHLEVDFFDSVSELLVQLCVRDLVLAALEGGRAGMLVDTAALCFNFQVGTPTYSHDFLRVYNLCRLNVQISLRTLLLTCSKCALNTESTFHGVSLLPALNLLGDVAPRGLNLATRRVSHILAVSCIVVFVHRTRSQSALGSSLGSHLLSGILTQSNMAAL